MIVAVMLVIGHMEWHVTRHGRVAASREGSATDRDSLSTRHADGSPMLVEVDAAAMAEFVLSQRAGCHGCRVCPAYPAVICPLSEGDAVSGLWMLTEAGLLTE